MRPTDPDERRRVRVQYVPRGFGLALTITDTSNDNPSSDDPSGEPQVDQDQATANDVTIESDDVEIDDGYLTVVASGVTTLELRRPDGELSLLIWDESEVAWDSLRAG